LFEKNEKPLGFPQETKTTINLTRLDAQLLYRESANIESYCKRQHAAVQPPSNSNTRRLPQNPITQWCVT
jgi:hypothetical protein